MINKIENPTYIKELHPKKQICSELPRRARTNKLLSRLGTNGLKKEDGSAPSWPMVFGDKGTMKFVDGWTERWRQKQSYAVSFWKIRYAISGSNSDKVNINTKSSGR